MAVSAGWRTSKHVHHVVDHIIAPFGPPIEERPRVPTAEERIREKEERKQIKDERRALRRAGDLAEGGEGETDIVGLVKEEAVEPLAEVPEVQAVKASKVETTKPEAVREKVRSQEVKAEEPKPEETESPKKTSWWG